MVDIQSWPFQEAQRIVARVAETGKPALFETGYGPSGLPHIGTFGEVARTSWVRKAYHSLTGIYAPLLAFSDDMDGLRAVPGNVPNQDMLKQHLGKPLTDIPDPFGLFESFGHHNNAMLRRFLDRFGFEYEFGSATDYYKSGRFNAGMRRVLECHDEIMSVILPTLGKDKKAQERDRASSYSPILPVHPRTGIVMQVHIDKIDVDAGTVFWTDDDGIKFETNVYDGRAKCQWKADWAMRWYALGIDYEMSGKDLIDSVTLSTQICRILGGVPPLNFTYEMFLDKDGKKVSKSKGNGIAVEEWLRYGPEESLSQFMYSNPQRAKKMTFEAIPRATDEYLMNAEKFLGADKENPVWFFQEDTTPTNRDLRRLRLRSPISFAMLLNLVSVINATSTEMLWGFIQSYRPELTPETEPYLTELVEYALVYYNDFILPAKKFRAPSEIDVAALRDLRDVLASLPEDSSAEVFQFEIFEVGKRHPYPSLKNWFGSLYEVLLGQTEGPRFGAFVALYGAKNTIALIDEKLS